MTVPLPDLRVQQALLVADARGVRVRDGQLAEGWQYSTIPEVLAGLAARAGV